MSFFKTSRLIRRRDNIFIIFFAVFLILLIVVTAASLRGYNENLADKYQDYALGYSKLQSAALGSAVNALLSEAQSIAAAVPSQQGVAIEYMLHNVYVSEGHIESIRYFSDGAEYDQTGQKIVDETPELLEMVRAGSLGISGLVYDNELGKSCFGAFVPILDNDLINGIIIYYNISAFEQKLSLAKQDSSVFTALCANDGTIVIADGDFVITRNENVYRRLRDLTNDKPLVDSIEKNVKNIANTSYKTSISDSDFVLTFATEPSVSGKWFTIEIFDYNAFISNETTFISTFGTLVVLISLFLILLLSYLIYYRIKVKKDIDDSSSINCMLGCPTINRFYTDVENILNRNKVSSFAIVNFKINRYEYILENFGEVTGNEVLQFIVKVLQRSITIGETYGHIGSEEFAMLLHYKDAEALTARLEKVNAVIENYPGLKEYSYSMKSSFGIYEVDRTMGFTLQKMLDRAKMAQKANSNAVNNIRFFDKEMEAQIHREAEFEAMIYKSLKKGDFYCFYQPKYNIKQDRIDSAEALVRWHDPETEKYREPGEFLPFFEASGAIYDLDKYVFNEVCKFISSSIAKGQKMVPVAVNVSRASAIKQGFAEYYISTKRKYKIADGFLTIEFTESFAFQNYDVLKQIVLKLQENGFKCSVDDFGSGYSSYNVLKELAMDELKLDKFFIEPGISTTRDALLHKSVITMARGMGMRVVQEGVETQEEVERLKKFGCDVIQGFYYSKPLHQDDYINFIQSGK